MSGCGGGRAQPVSRETLRSELVPNAYLWFIGEASAEKLDDGRLRKVWAAGCIKPGGTCRAGCRPAMTAPGHCEGPLLHSSPVIRCT